MASEGQEVKPPVKRSIQKSVLMTPDPYHVPGYGGFCPQFKYQIGETFGRTTCRLLDNKAVASSGRLVLAKINPDNMETEARTARVGVITDRTQSWGDQKLMGKMVPGYTGFIPRSQHYFGNRYAENCVNAICDFELSMKDSKQRGSLPPIQSKMEPIQRDAKPFLSENTPHHTMSPFYMVNDNQDKRFVSGYTGFVPRARGLIGMGYPYITHDALNEFTDDSSRLKGQASQPVNVKREAARVQPTTSIYPAHSGLVPHYTGHIPGEKFRYGGTFGHSTQNALKQLPVAASI